MDVRITFRAECYVKGETLKDVRERFASNEIFSDVFLDDFEGEYYETISVEDANTDEDLMHEYINIYN